MKPVRLKDEILQTFHSRLIPTTNGILAAPGTQKKKARQVNAAVNAVRAELASKIASLPVADQPNYAIVLQYCFSVASLEYRHKVWPYEYMAFSRRVGELWEAFCSVAWDYPSLPNVKRIKIPSFAIVRKVLLNRLKENIGKHGKKSEILEDVDTLLSIVGDINMKEDEVFEVNGVPHVIDFKSGFGSNEKGNMLRLQTVGRAYRIWNHQTRLLLLVRQAVNNNYLNVLHRTGLWEVHTSSEAYKRISELTGADMNAVRANVVDWPADVSGCLYDYLKKQNLTSYLEW